MIVYIQIALTPKENQYLWSEKQIPTKLITSLYHAANISIAPHARIAMWEIIKYQPMCSFFWFLSITL